MRLLQKPGSKIRYQRPTDDKEYKISVLVFSDAGGIVDYGQLGIFAGLLIGDFNMRSILHTLNWSSNRSKGPVKSIGAAELLVAGKATDDGKVLAHAKKALTYLDVDLLVESI